MLDILPCWTYPIILNMNHTTAGHGLSWTHPIARHMTINYFRILDIAQYTSLRSLTSFNQNISQNRKYILLYSTIISTIIMIFTHFVGLKIRQKPLDYLVQCWVLDSTPQKNLGLTRSPFQRITHGCATKKKEKKRPPTNNRFRWSVPFSFSSLLYALILILSPFSSKQFGTTVA